MNTNADLPQVHKPGHVITAGGSARRETTSTTSDLPLTNNSLASTNISTVEEGVLKHEPEDEAHLLDKDLFKNCDTRIEFIEKVLTLKLLQMLCMTLFMAVFLANYFNSSSFKERGSIVLPILMSGALVVVNILFIVTCGNPFRYIFLVTFPLNLSAFISILAIFLNQLNPIILSCIYYYIVVCALLLCSVFAFHSKLQFVTKYINLIVIGIQLVATALTFFYLDMNLVTVVCSIYASCIFTVEYIHVIVIIEAMTAADYWSIITRDHFINAARNMYIDYYYIFHKFGFPKISHRSRRIMNRDVEI